MFDINFDGMFAFIYKDIQQTFQLRALLTIANEILFVVIFGPAISTLVNTSNYLIFISLGFLVTATLSGAFETAYSLFHEEKSWNQFEYYLTLPLSRKELLLGKIIGGIGRSLIYFMPIFFLIIFLYNLLSLNFILGVFGMFFLISTFFIGLFLLLVIIVQNYYFFNIISVNGINFVKKFSTVFYPLSIFPIILAPFIFLNPVSIGAFSVRALANGIFTWQEWVFLGFISLSSLLEGFIVYDRKLEYILL